MHYTAICRRNGRLDTLWQEPVEASGSDVAINAAQELAAKELECSPDDITVIGLAPVHISDFPWHDEGIC